jgi:hypothetical protein
MVLLLAVTARAAEIRTGAMLGGSYDARAFYVRGAPGESWQKTYSGPAYRAEAQGKLMNVRVSQPSPGDLDLYRSHGVLMVDVCADGAFRPDGSLDPERLERLERLLRAADERGMMVNLIYFRAEDNFQSTAAIDQAASHLTGWLIAKDFRNVLVDVANEYDLPGGQWRFQGYIPQNIIPLIDEVRERYGHAGYTAPVSASSDGRMLYPKSLEGQVDMVLLHGNGRDAKEKARRAAQLKNVRRPVLMTGDGNGRGPARDRLEQDLASCDIFFHQAEGWGFSASEDKEYLHAVLEHIASLTLKSPPRETQP